MDWLRDPDLKPIAAKVEAGERLSFEEGMYLFRTRDLNGLMRLADLQKRRLHGDKVYFVHSMRLEFTNICYVGCTFCAFAAHKGEERAWDYSPEEVVQEVGRRYLPGITELHMSSGHHPNHPWEYYPAMVRGLRAAYPDLQVKAFTAAEIKHLSRIARKPTLEVLRELQAAGLSAMPGGGAEIFAERVRRQVAKNKVKSDEWLQIHSEAHSLGMRTNATMLYGHIETLEERLDHMHRLRELQDDSLHKYGGGFHAFIPLAFQPLGNTLAQNLGKTEYTTGLDDLRNLAVARIYLDNFPHIKGYWVMIGSELTQVSLDWGVSDIDGTIQEEHIAHAAGATSPMRLSEEGLIRMIQRAGRLPVLRDAYYNELAEFPAAESSAAD
ncbi:putative menaquinone biosynthesis protein [Deinococcus proteolyticus MRP]|uniref:Aminodeoxyfutalosine synthase n=1 Tax=Deinococcus proteolyticus (strain ATCC 35074 / DSM 20540 / JCM 6276 / NBRC 101906 / NCIMB 13154 / VKM Ac-1939 / CCM 2703 / MRP) TaxID=693977 RepID=F0RME0_DEIPM|nr:MULTISPECIES: aminofutalosine synthase MqnE [Deinococcus]ADY27077.1 putative menaquinone biosynthesis protein [Deinococcus proteolyticus MRP]MCY1703201.1 aminofutalosine synthase MqnE [Deinococcus sp. SL84]